MPIEISIDKERQIVRARAFGVVRLHDIFAYLDEVVVQHASPFAKLFDARGCDFILDDGEMMELGARMSAYAQHAPGGPVALVADSDRTFLVFARFLNLSTGSRRGASFRALDEATSWLAAQPT